MAPRRRVRASASRPVRRRATTARVAARRAIKAATDAFRSSGQYAGVVYGKAAAFYRTLEDELGRDRVAAALADVVREHAFEVLDADGLRDSLARSLGGGDRFERLWTRWMERRRGDEDLGVDPGAGLGGLLGGGADGQDLGELSDLLGELIGGLEAVRRS